MEFRLGKKCNQNRTEIEIAIEIPFFLFSSLYTLHIRKKNHDYKILERTEMLFMLTNPKCELVSNFLWGINFILLFSR